MKKKSLLVSLSFSFLVCTASCIVEASQRTTKGTVNSTNPNKVTIGFKPITHLQQSIVITVTSSNDLSDLQKKLAIVAYVVQAQRAHRG